MERTQQENAFECSWKPAAGIPGINEIRYAYGLGVLYPSRAAGILIQPHVNLKSEVLSWAIILLIVVVLFVFLQMVKPFFQKKKSTIQAIDQIKQYYYERYKKYGLDKMEPWN